MYRAKELLYLIAVFGFAFPGCKNKGNSSKPTNDPEIRITIDPEKLSQLKQINILYKVCPTPSIVDKRCVVDQSFVDKMDRRTYDSSEIVGNKIKLDLKIDQGSEFFLLGAELIADVDGAAVTAGRTFFNLDTNFPSSQDCQPTTVFGRSATDIQIKVCELAAVAPKIDKPWDPSQIITEKQNALIAPISTCGRWIVNNEGYRLKLASVNWYGANTTDMKLTGLDSQKIDTIIGEIKKNGFNSVRLPFSKDMWYSNEKITSVINPEINGLSPKDAFKWAVGKITGGGLGVILDYHSRKAMWCASSSSTECDPKTNFYWFSEEKYAPKDEPYTEAQWILDWLAILGAFKDNKLVFGADLYNAIRHPEKGDFLPITEVTVPGWRNPLAVEYGWTTWGPNNPLDWRRAASRAIFEIQKKHPDILFFVQGNWYSNYFRNDQEIFPIVASLPNKVVYSPHEFPDFHGFDTLESRWSFYLKEGQPYTSPIWIGEFGATPNHLADANSNDAKWFSSMVGFLEEQDIDFAMWGLNSGKKQQSGEDTDAFGLMKSDWSAFIDGDPRMEKIKSILQPVRGPGYDRAPCMTPSIQTVEGQTR